MMDISQYVGIPYREAARGPDAFDCYGLVAKVFRDQKGIELPDWYSSGISNTSRAIASAIAGETIAGRGQLVESPVNFDIAVIKSTDNPHHVGVVLEGGVLHAVHKTGSVWLPLPRFKSFYPFVEFYRWQL